MAEIGRIKRVSLRDVWKHEAFDFTKWLENNIDILTEVLDINLSTAGREIAAGGFNVDLVAEDDSGNTVVIENQLEKSDHDHLGKLLTYFTNMEAKAAVWIVADPRPEHINAIAWLNESTAASFYLIKVEAVCIGESPSAPLLTLIVGPSEEGRKVGETKKKMVERHRLRRKFWSDLLEYARGRTKLHANISPSIYNWIGASAGVNGLGYNYSITKHEGSFELYIDRGKESHSENKAIFLQLVNKKEEIEKVFGEPLDWQHMEGRRACRIIKSIKGGYRDDEEKWPAIYEAMVDAMIRLEKAFRPHLLELKVY